MRPQALTPQLQTVDSGVNWVGTMVLDGSGNPVITYFGPVGIKLVHCGDPTCSGSKSIQTVATPRSGGFRTSLKLDSLGYPVITYWQGRSPDGTTDVRDLMLAHCGDANCSSANIQTVDSAGSVGYPSSLALDSLGDSVISYLDSTNHTLKLARVQADTCGAGQYDNGTGCVNADPGYHVPTAGATAQIPCVAGTYQPNAGSSSCLSASAGHFVSSTAAISQTPCALGTYQPDTGATSCNSASAGNFVPTTRATTQTACPVGTFQPNTGASSCAQASPGNYVSSTGAIAQTPCAPGSYQPNSGATTCIPASTGSYVPSAGAIAQIPCPTGTTSTAGATTCVFNFSGFFQPVDNLPTVNQVKAGSAIPVTFSLSGNQGLNIMAAGSPSSATISCASGAALDDIEQTLTAGNSSLSYDATSGTYTYV